MRLKHVWIIGLTVLLSACSTAQTSTPLPTPAAINLIFLPDLKPWADQLGTCAAHNPHAAVYFESVVNDASQLRSNDIMLLMGNPSQNDPSVYSALLGWEQIEVIVNQQNESPDLSLEQLRSIYTGQSAMWGNSSSQPIEVWVLPADSPTRMTFDQAVIPHQRLASDAMLAPDPMAMLEAIGEDKYAIGYLPGSFLKSGDAAQTAQVRRLSMVSMPMEDLQAPVVALTLGEPQGIMRQLLLCLQADPP